MRSEPGNPTAPEPTEGEPPDFRDLLAELRAGGRLESRGVFTLDPEAALEKLRRYRLAERHHFVLPLLSAAVLGGASRFRVYGDADDVILDFDGLPFSGDELGDLLSHVLGRPGRPAVKDLATGVNAARALEPLWIHVESGGARLVLEGAGVRLEGGSEVPGTRVHVRDRFRWRTVRRWVRKAWDTVPEVAALAERGSLAPLELEAAGRGPLSRPFDPGPAVAWRRLAGSGGFRFVRPEAAFRDEIPAGGNFEAVMALGVPRPEGLRLVLDGVSWAPPEPWEAWPELALVASAPDLRVDLSRANLVADEAWEALSGHLERAVERMLVDLCRARPGLRRDQHALLVPALQRLLERLGPDSEDRLPVLEQRALSVQALDEPGGPGTFEAHRELARALRLAGREAEALQAWRDALEHGEIRLARAWEGSGQGRDLNPTVLRTRAEEVEALVREGGPEDPVRLARALEDLGEACALAGDDEACLSAWRRRLALPGEPGTRAQALEACALAERRLGRPERSAPLHGEAEALLRAHLPVHDPARSEPARRLAALDLASGRPADALARLDRAARELREAGVPVPPPLLEEAMEAGLLAEDLPAALRALEELLGQRGSAFASRERTLEFHPRGWYHRAVLKDFEAWKKGAPPALLQEHRAAWKEADLGQAFYHSPLFFLRSTDDPRREELSYLHPLEREYFSTAVAYEQYGSLDLAVRTFRRALDGCGARSGAWGEPWRRVAWHLVPLLRRMGRLGEADRLWARLAFLEDVASRRWGAASAGSA